jgi:hypothetical protein
VSLIILRTNCMLGLLCSTLQSTTRLFPRRSSKSDLAKAGCETFNAPAFRDINSRVCGYFLADVSPQSDRLIGYSSHGTRDRQKDQRNYQPVLDGGCAPLIVLEVV